MTAEALDPAAIDAFIARWANADGTERANYQLFALDLCELLGVAKPNPASTSDGGNAYVFERNVTASFADGSRAARFIDLYKRGCFVLEAKQSGKKLNSRGQTRTLEQAWVQAEQYARSLPAEEGRPPFIIVVDVGRTIDLYAEFSRSGATYTAFPAANSNRITLADLHKPEVQYRLRRLWSDPTSLDPANYSAKVTRKISDKLAELAKSLEQSGHPAEAVAGFLSRCLFTMFAEDVELLPPNSFRDLLLQRANEPDKAMNQTRALWRDMATGTDYSAAIEARVLRFNGGLFENADVLPLDKAQLAMLIDAAKADWRHVEPAIFGTLLERALSPGERHKLGAHYTPRAYVERLVLPTVIEPLRDEWKDVQAAAKLKAKGKGVKARNEAVALLKSFQHRLCTIRVLDPACGSGNFLYVTLDHMKRLEAEVLAELDKLGQATLEAEGLTVSPHQLLGIEVNPRAARIAELVLWIGYLQWHYRTFKHLNLPEPVLRDFRNIENRDAVLAYDEVVEVLDSDGQPMTSWDGRTFKVSPVTGEQVPDESAQAPLLRYLNPRKAEWPDAAFIVGNPPFIGNKRMRFALGDGYVDALRAAWGDVPDTSDFVMYWWSHAAALARSGRVRRFGLITTNSIGQTFNRQVLESALTPSGKPPRGDRVALNLNQPMASNGAAVALNLQPHGDSVSLVFAIPDHPWVDSGDGADVRISMTVAESNYEAMGRLERVIAERLGDNGEIDVLLAPRHGVIHSDLSVGAKVVAAQKLVANANVCFQGMNLVGKGFRLEPEEVSQLGYDLANLPEVIKPHCNARDMMQGGAHCYVIDFFGYTADEARAQHPALYQRLLDRVKPERDHNKDAQRRRDWWLFGRANTALRASWAGVKRMILTPETSKHRVFQYQDRPFCPDHKLYAICLDDPYYLGILSSEVHLQWALSAGGTLEDRPTWTNTTCFATFPFPACEGELTARIRSLAELIDAHRKDRAAMYPGVTLTGTYNVLAKLRSGGALTAKEKTIHEHGLVSVLKQLHDDLDAAVLEAYGWTDLQPGAADFAESVLTRLVALNAQRVTEEAAGTIRWLRPEYQNPDAADTTPTPVQATLGVESVGEARAAPSVAVKQQTWPTAMAAQFKVVRSVLATGAQTAATLAAQFKGRSREADIAEILDTLEGLGQVIQLNDGRYALI